MYQEISGNESRKSRKSNFMAYLIFCVSAGGGLLFGYIIGATSNIVTDQTEANPGGIICAATYNSTDPCLNLDDFHKGILTSINVIGALCGTFFAFAFGEVLGRRRELIGGMCLYVCGCLLSALLPLNYIYFGQFVYGLGVALSMHAAPIYISETAPSAVRGALVSAKEGVIVVGILMGNGVGYGFSHTAQGYRWMTVAPVVLAVPIFFCLTLLPSSPRWYYRRTGDVEGTRNLLQLIRRGYNIEEISAELDTIVSTLAADAQAVDAKAGKQSMSLSGIQGQTEGTSQSSFMDVFAPRYRKALVIGCGLVLLQQLTGQPSVLYYATNIFKSAGFKSSAGLQPVFVSCSKLVFTCITVWQVDRYGRRLLLFIGIGMMTVSLIALGLAFYHQVCQDPSFATKDCPSELLTLPQPWGSITLASLMLYVGGYQVGFGPIAWLMISEIFSLKVRGSAMSIAAICNFGGNLLVTILFNNIITWIGADGAFWLYAGMCLVSLVFVFLIVPETKGLTLEQIEAKLTGEAFEEIDMHTHAGAETQGGSYHSMHASGEFEAP